MNLMARVPNWSADTSSDDLSPVPSNGMCSSASQVSQVADQSIGHFCSSHRCTKLEMRAQIALPPSTGHRRWPDTRSITQPRRAKHSFQMQKLAFIFSLVCGRQLSGLHSSVPLMCEFFFKFYNIFYLITIFF